MGVLYDLSQDVAGDPAQQEGSFELWIDWRRSALSIPGKDDSDYTKAENIQLFVNYTLSVEPWAEPPLETEFRSLAYATFPIPIDWKYI
jgi:hypothetical protein